MATNESTERRPPFLAVALYYGTYLVIFSIIGLALFLGWPGIVATFHARMSGQSLPQPTALIVPRAPAPPRIESVPAPIPGIAQNEATAQAQYDAAVQAAEPVPNTGQGAPAVNVSRPADRAGAGENVPTAEPVVENSGIFGSKPVLVNPQADHTCKHGQVWTEKGCKNP